MESKPISYQVALLRASFVLYTAALLTATHWPGLAIKGPFNRMDLVIHAGTFGLWTLLLGMTGWIRSSCTRRRALRVCVIGVLFGLFDETTQPLFRRVFDLLDLAADAGGVILASLLLGFIWSRSGAHQIINTPESVAHQPPDTRS